MTYRLASSSTISMVVSIKITLPPPEEWKLRIFIFARWARDPPPPVGTVATWKDLKYYLRVMRGPHWKMTVRFLYMWKRHNKG